MWYIWQWFQFGGLVNHVSITKLNVCHFGCKHGFLSIQYSKPPNKILINCIFRENSQIFDLPIIPHIVSYELSAYKQFLQLICWCKPLIKPIIRSHVSVLGVRTYAAI